MLQESQTTPSTDILVTFREKNRELFTQIAKGITDIYIYIPFSMKRDLFFELLSRYEEDGVFYSILWICSTDYLANYISSVLDIYRKETHPRIIVNRDISQSSHTLTILSEQEVVNSIRDLTGVYTMSYLDSFDNRSFNMSLILSNRTSNRLMYNSRENNIVDFLSKGVDLHYYKDHVSLLKSMFKNTTIPITVLLIINSSDVDAIIDDLREKLDVPVVGSIEYIEEKNGVYVSDGDYELTFQRPNLYAVLDTMKCDVVVSTVTESIKSTTMKISDVIELRRSELSPNYYINENMIIERFKVSQHIDLLPVQNIVLSSYIHGLDPHGLNTSYRQKHIDDVINMLTKYGLIRRSINRYQLTSQGKSYYINHSDLSPILYTFLIKERTVEASITVCLLNINIRSLFYKNGKYDYINKGSPFEIIVQLWNLFVEELHSTFYKSVIEWSKEKDINGRIFHSTLICIKKLNNDNGFLYRKLTSREVNHVRRILSEMCDERYIVSKLPNENRLTEGTLYSYIPTNIIPNTDALIDEIKLCVISYSNRAFDNNRDLLMYIPYKASILLLKEKRVDVVRPKIRLPPTFDIEKLLQDIDDMRVIKEIPEIELKIEDIKEDILSLFD